VSLGQVVSTPLQFSATSQSPAAERQTTNAPATLSPGQAVLAPSHVSATSHAPFAERQTVPELAS
jgi:hypothetical protein